MEKDIVWLPKELAIKVKEVDDVKFLESEILEYVNKTKGDIKEYITGMDEDMVQYRAMMIKSRESFKKAKEEELDAFYSLWEKYEEDIISVRNKITKMKAELTPLTEEVKELKNLCQSVDTWGIDKLASSIEKVTQLYGTEKQMFEFLVNNFKKVNGN